MKTMIKKKWEKSCVCVFFFRKSKDFFGGIDGARFVFVSCFFFVVVLTGGSAAATLRMDELLWKRVGCAVGNTSL